MCVCVCVRERERDRERERERERASERERDREKERERERARAWASMPGVPGEKPSPNMFSFLLAPPAETVTTGYEPSAQQVTSVYHTSPCLNAPLAERDNRFPDGARPALKSECSMDCCLGTEKECA